MNPFWTGFEKRANLQDAAKAGIRAATNVAKKTVDDVTERVIDYRKLENPTQMPAWKRKFQEAQKQKAIQQAKAVVPEQNMSATDALKQRQEAMKRSGNPQSKT